MGFTVSFSFRVCVGVVGPIFLAVDPHWCVLSRSRVGTLIEFRPRSRKQTEEATVACTIRTTTVHSEGEGKGKGRDPRTKYLGHSHLCAEILRPASVNISATTPPPPVTMTHPRGK